MVSASLISTGLILLLYMMVALSFMIKASAVSNWVWSQFIVSICAVSFWVAPTSTVIGILLGILCKPCRNSILLHVVCLVFWILQYCMISAFVD